MKKFPYLGCALLIATLLAEIGIVVILWDLVAWCLGFPYAPIWVAAAIVFVVNLVVFYFKKK